MRMVTMEEAFTSIQSGMNVYVQGMASTPHQLLEGLAVRAASLENVKLFHLHLEGPTPWVAPQFIGRVKDVSLFVGPNLREAVNAGQADYVPLFLSEVPWFLAQPQFRPNVVFMNVSPPDRHGYVSLGPTIEATLHAMRQADIVVAQINREVPRVLGDALVSVNDITFGILHDEPLASIVARPADGVSQAIGRYVAELVPDRATLQLGIGRIPNAVLKELAHHKDLGIHSEMISDGVQTLIEQGVVTGRYKVTDPGKVITTFCLGSPALYDFVDDNPVIEIKSVDYTNNTAVIRQNPRMVSVNSAIEVDVLGQVVADSIGSRIVSGVGGQMDFVRGASLAPEGKSIIALPSRTASGMSRIVLDIHPGASVTTTRHHVQFVVTEYGIAELHGKTLTERVEQLIKVAHPEDRESLTKAARDRLPSF